MDYNTFTMNEKNYGLLRYGYGSSGITLGNGFGLRLGASSGFGIMTYDSPIQITIDLSGRLVYNTNPMVLSYYQFTPGIGVGPQFRLGAAKILVLGKGGPIMTSLNRSDVLPNFRLYVGGGAYIALGLAALGGEVLTFDGITELGLDVSAKTDLGRFGIKLDQVKQETSGTLFYEFKPL